jgi:hypothetical protein
MIDDYPGIVCCENGEELLFYRYLFTGTAPGIGTHEIQGDLVGGGDLKELFQKERLPSLAACFLFSRSRYNVYLPAFSRHEFFLIF